MKNGDLVTCPKHCITGVFYHAHYFAAWRDVPPETYGFIIRVIAPLNEAVAALQQLNDCSNYPELYARFNGNVKWALLDDIEPLSPQTKPKHRRGKRHRMRTGGLLGEAVL